MNRKRLTKLAEWLEAGAEHETITFDMEQGFVRRRLDTTEPYNAKNPSHNRCMTTCCLAGAAVQFFNKPDKMFNAVVLGDDEDQLAQFEQGVDVGVPWHEVKSKAVDLLELEWHQASILFTPDDEYGIDLSEFSDPAWAARTIRYLLKTGEVDWATTSDGHMRQRMIDSGFLPEEEEEALAD